MLRSACLLLALVALSLAQEAPEKSAADLMNADPVDDATESKETFSIVQDADDDDDEKKDDEVPDVFLPFHNLPHLPNFGNMELEIIPLNRPPSPFMHHVGPHFLPFQHMPHHPMFPFGGPPPSMEFEVELPRGHRGLPGLLDSLIPEQPHNPFMHQGLMQMAPPAPHHSFLDTLFAPPAPAPHHSFLDSILDGLLDLPEHLKTDLEERHTTIPSDHEPMVMKMEKKNEFYVVTGWFPGVGKDDLSIKVEGSDLKVEGNVTDKSEQTQKDLGQFADIDEVQESMELPYAPDGRFVKAHFDDKKHTLTVVFPQEKSSKIELS